MTAPLDQRAVLRALDDTFERLRAERDTARAEVADLRRLLGIADADADRLRALYARAGKDFASLRAENNALRAELAEARDDPGRPFTPDERLHDLQGRLGDLEDRVERLERGRPATDGIRESLRHIKGA